MTRKATAARGKALGRQGRDTPVQQVDPTQRAANAPVQVTSVLDPVGEERLTGPVAGAPHPGAAAGNHSPTMGRQAKGRLPSLAS